MLLNLFSFLHLDRTASNVAIHKFVLLNINLPSLRSFAYRNRYSEKKISWWETSGLLLQPLALLYGIGSMTIWFCLHWISPFFISQVSAASDTPAAILREQIQNTPPFVLKPSAAPDTREAENTVVYSTGRRAVKSLLEMRQDKTVIQQWDLSCGAAALATLLNYQHGDPVTEQEIATGLMQRKEYLSYPKLVQIRQGFSLLDLKRYVDQRGYKGVGYGQLSFKNLIERAPIMVPVYFNGYNHFVVFRGTLSGRVLLSDPAWGNRTMQLEKFENAWIVYPEIGKVGFVVLRRDGSSPPNKLGPRRGDFVMFK